MNFLEKWGNAAYTTLGFFWMALWAFILGYIVSSMIQVFVTQDRMKQSMGQTGAKSVGLATFFGFISSSCSFAALATTKSLFKKGAGLIPSLAFLLASTNLVIELGIVIAIFLSWQFVVGEYIGGVLLILLMWIFVRLTRPQKMVKKAREKLHEEEEMEHGANGKNWKQQIRSKEGWIQVGQKYSSEWKMVWKDVTVGFTIAGIIAAFVPSEAFQWLFTGTGSVANQDLSFLQVLQHTLVGPLAAFMTFIGSMGNIPLAAVLFDNGVSTAGVMAFIFSDLVVFPVLRINARYYGWKMSLYILLSLLFGLIITSLLLHYGFEFAGLTPTPLENQRTDGAREFFKMDYGFVLNIIFLFISGLLIWLSAKSSKGKMDMGKSDLLEKILYWLSMAAYTWLLGGVIIKFLL